MPACSLALTGNSNGSVFGAIVVCDPSDFIGEALAGDVQSLACGTGWALPVAPSMATSASVAAAQEMGARSCHEDMSAGEIFGEGWKREEGGGEVGEKRHPPITTCMVQAWGYGACSECGGDNHVRGT